MCFVSILFVDVCHQISMLVSFFLLIDTGPCQVKRKKRRKCECYHWLAGHGFDLDLDHGF